MSRLDAGRMWAFAWGSLMCGAIRDISKHAPVWATVGCGVFFVIAAVMMTCIKERP